jgi:predicted ArsR family transcriptional regulator
MRLLATMLAAAAAIGGVDSEQAADAGFVTGLDQGEAAGMQRKTSAARCVSALTDQLAALGFDPAVGEDGASATVAFTHCPFQELAEAFPDLVCHLHRGMVEGFVNVPEEVRVTDFHTLADRDPCRVELSLR